jgi:hypothetical protein
MAKKIKLGIIGISEGNGHPYSWSAIINGYDKFNMARCPFPVIPEYLSRQKYPEEFLTDLAEVTHIWTQDISVSQNIALTTRIPNICQKKEEMIGEVDAVLLARDDAENHYTNAKLFLKAGIPIYIDKPFAVTMNDANKLWSICTFENQIFTCSAIQFAKEFDVINFEEIGRPHSIWAIVSKSWNKYAVHIIEPVLRLIPERGALLNIEKLPILINDNVGVQVKWSSGLIAQFQTTGSLPAPLSIRILGDRGQIDLLFEDSFYAFKAALKKFINVVINKEENIPRNFTKEMVQILEKGNA